MNSMLIGYVLLLGLLFISVIIYSIKGLGLLRFLTPAAWGPKPVENKDDPKSWWQTFGYIALFTIFSRLVICLVAYVAIILERGPQTGGFIKYFFDTFIGPGDTPHYLKIAAHWYARSGPDAKYIVFYPLYPACIMAVNFLVSKLLLGGLIVSQWVGWYPSHPIYATLKSLAEQSYFLSGILISNVCLIVACYFLYRWVSLDYEEAKARRAVIFFLLYPFSVFLIGVFTESLFIMPSIMVFYYMRQQKWWITGLLGFLAGMTRTQGIILTIPVLYEYALANQWFTGFRLNGAGIIRTLKKLKPDFLSILLMPLGFGGYLLINQIIQGDWFAFYKHITAEPWWQGQDWIGNNLYQHYDISQQYFSLGLLIYKVQIAAFFIFCGLILYGLWKRVRMSYLTYMLAYLMVTFTSSWMISGPRYMMSDIPLYIVLAAVAQKRNVQAAILILLGLLCVFYTIMFFQGQAIM